MEEERYFSFERIVVAIAIEEGDSAGILEYPDKDKYGNQSILIAEVDE
ncbi:MAG: hypothetical protein JXA79_12020 [Deltaproteobacteria bacterium]|nr:hypothetical protein [Deltaproteobacteria bacterium]